MVGAPARVYTAEVSQPHLRGMLSAMASVGVSTGVLIQVSIASFVIAAILVESYRIYMSSCRLNFVLKRLVL
jgi:hypothetical protein